jgi:hypothetical protein
MHLKIIKGDSTFTGSQMIQGKLLCALYWHIFWRLKIIAVFKVLSLLPSKGTAIFKKWHPAKILAT